MREFEKDYPDEYQDWVMDDNYKFSEWDKWLYDNFGKNDE